ncbi:50S ribosomal protein L28 [Candidatus Riesia sp. GBBU]|nr:50S ribosomal protein L28 [Candidatus Riesia sp. GBBU]
MSKYCEITGKKTITGNRRSHSMCATKRRFFPNLHYHRYWVSSKKKFIKLRISSKGMRILDKKGVDWIFNNYNFRKIKRK